jgi:hypothetical protein
LLVGEKICCTARAACSSHKTPEFRRIADVMIGRIAGAIFGRRGRVSADVAAHLWGRAA